MLCFCLWNAVYYFVHTLWQHNWQTPCSMKLYEALWSSHDCRGVGSSDPGVLTNVPVCANPPPPHSSSRRLIIRLNGVRGRGLLIVCQGPGNNWAGRNENIIQIFENLSAQLHRYFLYTSINNCLTANSPNQFIWLEIIACTESRGSEMFTMGI